jgi:hypothetical protein
VVVVTSVNRLVTARPYSAPYVEAPDPDIIVRRFRDLGKDHDPSDASAGQVDPMPRLTIVCQPRSPRLRNPDQLQRGKRYAMPGGEQGSKEARKWLDNKPQLKGRLTSNQSTSNLTPWASGSVRPKLIVLVARRI